MSTKVIVRETEQKEITYPCLMVNRDKTTILFVLDKQGFYYRAVALKHPNIKEANATIDDWRADSFKPLEGDTTISNK